MARTLNDIVQEQFGAMNMALCQATAENEQLKARVAELEKQIAAPKDGA